MATIVLAAAGSAVGGAIGGSVLGVSAAAIGQAVGGIAGGLIDQQILGRGSKAVEVGRARSLRLQSSTEGAPMPITFGRIRLAGTVIWSTRFLESVRDTTQGGKATGGGQSVSEYSYSISLAVALCEGPIQRIGRVWADGKLLDTAELTMRVYTGDEEQLPDPKIEAVEGVGNVPSYRGTAYVVFEDLPLGRFGNRIPQLNFEVHRSARLPGVPLDPVYAGEPLPDLIKGVALSPGTGEFALHPEPQHFVYEGGTKQYANVNNGTSRPDMMVALDQLEADLPACDHVSLVVSWFGDDLRCGHCRVEPRVEVADRGSEPEVWSVSGLSTGSARLVSQNEEGRPNYGGTPSDASVVAAIKELKGRGKSVMIYPFLLMDITADNTLPNPHKSGETQPPFPWRGRITLDAAPGQPGSTDQTAAAAGDVDAFFGAARASDFSVSGESVQYSGPAGDWTWRRFVLHLAALGKAAGGVDSIVVGSELIGLTQIRSSRTTYPAVQQLRTLAAEVRSLLPGAKISYAADWSEYFGHHPADGSGDHIFHLDPLWSHPDIDFVGIDDYMSCSDWRHQPTHLDGEAGARSVYSLPYLKSNVAGGENYDWFYGSEADRTAQVRTPIEDTAHGEDWVFRPKDLVNWWSNQHHDRVGGVRTANSTGWVPESKPIWLTETGCPSVDLGANRPNLFFDPKSSESGLPYGSRGARDDEMQRRYLQAKLGFWGDAAENPVSNLYGGPMLPTERIYVWTWDARPWPDFPNRESIWADGPNHKLGHWITGRVSASGLAEVVAAICARSGMLDYDVSDLHGTVYGYILERPQTARQALQSLMTCYGFDAFERAGRIVFRMRSATPDLVIDPAVVVDADEAGRAVDRLRASRGEGTDAVRLTYLDADSDFEQAASEAIRQDGIGVRVAETSVALAFPPDFADAVAARWLAEGERAGDSLSFALPPSQFALEPGDVIAFAAERSSWRIERLERGEALALEATQVDDALYLPRPSAARASEAALPQLAGPLSAQLLNLPLADGTARDHRPFVAANATPWPGDVAVLRAGMDDGLSLLGTIRIPTVAGVLESALPGGPPARWHHASFSVILAGGALSASTDTGVLNGANLLAVEAAPGAWELLQFRDATLIGPNRYMLSTLLRGRRGTEELAITGAAPGARCVLVDRALLEMGLSIDALGQPLDLRAGPVRHAVDHPSYVRFAGRAEGIGLRPFAPAGLRAKSDGSGGHQLRWIRRTRIGGDSWFGNDVPLGEEREAYRLRIHAGGALRREEALSTPSYHYTAALQGGDGIGGDFSVSVAQVSTVYGAGSERSMTIHG